MLRCLNRVTIEDEAPSRWKTSRTKMIKKTRRPTVYDYRPIALLDVGYKLYMGFIKKRNRRTSKEKSSRKREPNRVYERWKTRIRPFHTTTFGRRSMG